MEKISIDDFVKDGEDGKDGDKPVVRQVYVQKVLVSWIWTR